MPKHIHADLMMEAAEIAQTDAEWWKHFQAKSDDKIGCRNTRQSADSTDSK
ncbi:hypothetical protein [Xenorhabdus bovienii]|uniref:hypothetical protein n=1 Tax=Xenorhabdus bovienii TaxID=40576 RepID=UPI0023B25F61|nr:hypothetical protein [Xenorhabdus bovienii]MDE9455683.1 hypothetical protein [Xenorhabdus bovienii]